MSSKPRKFRVLELVPGESLASKPSELIQIRGHDSLTLNARRAITILWHHAHRQGIEPGRTYQIELDALVPNRHKGYEMVEEAIEALMTTLLVMPLPGGGTRRAQVLGGTDMDDPRRPAGTISYSFDWRLVEMLTQSQIWGKISLPELLALSSKYSISLYENVSQWVGLQTKTMQVFSLEEFRAMLGVEPGYYDKFGDLNRIVLKRSVEEINALAPFNIALLPRKTGKKVTHLQLNWWSKSPEERKAAYQELQRPRVGRRARIAGTVESVMAPAVSPSRAALRASQEVLDLEDTQDVPQSPDGSPDLS